MSFDQRIREAHEFERTVLDALRVRGWTAELCGRGQLPEGIRAFLRQVETPVRWLPGGFGE
jgi:hypothetical protein